MAILIQSKNHTFIIKPFYLCFALKENMVKINVSLFDFVITFDYRFLKLFKI